MSMLVNVVEAIEEVQAGGGSKDTSAKSAQGAGASAGSGKLQHVYVQSGSKWYGQHLGKYKTPAKETDPRWALQPHTV